MSVHDKKETPEFIGLWGRDALHMPRADAVRPYEFLNEKKAILVDTSSECTKETL